MKKILLKLYLIFLYYAGIEIIYFRIFRNEYQKKVDSIYNLFDILLESDYSKYSEIINDISLINMCGFKFPEYEYTWISDKTLQKYCERNNLVFADFILKYNDDISSLIEKRKIYYFFLWIGNITEKISSMYVFEKYFEYKAKMKYIKNNISEKDFINKLIKSDDTGLLKEYYDKIV
jgi:hypothetical protein